MFNLSRVHVPKLSGKIIMHEYLDAYAPNVTNFTWRGNEYQQLRWKCPASIWLL